ncbi:unnamed protein product [Brachionus calyciflorus]|uniref:SWIM-type domain-containing protein n=1 Tax=Brachionus calyciflorus TaxID=104777 RepID=A0A814J1U6_9BILA|nr:unnamed protein product [Brachionus calyciflorus]
MPYKITNQSSIFFKLLDQISDNQKMLFDCFNDVESLDEKFCEKITGWTKKEFLRFSSYITSINLSKGRTKEQLIALYRYWLRKGIDQTTLSMMFSNKTSQNTISRYLDQIRVAIYKDFVPFFLGSKKKKDFYLAHNTASVVELHDLNPDELAIVVDGTYCRCEKSSNNQFQYDSYSEQKKDSLIKPFIACCADGWIIDCYGPFKANKNDAKIFDYILINDNDLSNILEKDKTLILLDRGFRDIYKKLTDDYKLNAKIPTCKQLEVSEKENIPEEIKQLTLKQTTESRLVTKCRYIVERVNGMLKNYKALDNIRNTEIGHIQIDYRIACAMLNFTHKPFSENQLEFLLSKQLDTKIIPSVDIKTLLDFPKLTVETLKEDIFFGSFQYKESRSYFEDIIQNNRAFMVSNEFLRKNSNNKTNINFENTKTVAVEVPSRHKRSEKKKLSKKDIRNNLSKNFKNGYKVFVNYIPNGKGPESILGYICNCMSGRKILGTCVHVAAVISYLGFAQFNELKIKGKHLKKVFIDMEKSQKPNEPKYIRQKRNKKEIKCKTISILQEIPSSSNLKINNQNIKTGKEKLFNVQIFKDHVPKWGAYIEIEGEKNIYVKNTCTIDYLLLSFWYAAQLKNTFLDSIPEFEPKMIIKLIVKKINDLKWDEARQLWIERIMKFKLHFDQCSICLFGSESERFTRYLSVFQKYNIIKNCTKDCIDNLKIIRENQDIIFFDKQQENVGIDFGRKSENYCQICKALISNDIQFCSNPNFLLIHSKFLNIYLDNLPKLITIDKKNYKLMNATFGAHGHFRGIFLIEENFYLVDDIGQKMEKIEKIQTVTQKTAVIDYYTYPLSTFFYFLE